MQQKLTQHHKAKCIIQSLSHVQLFATPWITAHLASLTFTISQSLLRFLSIEFVMLSNHLILCHPLLLLPSIFPNIRVFSKELALHIRWPKYQSLNISPSNEYSELISFRIDWFGLLAVQGTLKRLLQHDSSKALILQGSAFFMVKLSHPYLTAAAAKSLQLCPTLWDPIDCSPPGSPVSGILQARTLEWVALTFSNA